MANTLENLKKMSIKGRQSPRTGKHGKHKITLLKEQILREHAEKVLGVVNEMADIQIELARFPVNKKRPNSKLMDVKLRASESIVDRVLGKAQTHNINLNVELPVPLYAGSAE